MRTGETVSDALRVMARAPRDWWAPRFRVGVTGLAGAGKTTFLVSLINQFENLVALDWRHRPGLSRIVSARWHEDPDGALTDAVFPYRAALERLTSTPPRWPESTDGCSTARIDLRARRVGWIDRLRGDFEATVELVDYPGEWLLDLALLNLDYAGFSRAMLEVLAAPEGPEIARVVYAELHHIDRTQPPDAARLGALLNRYADALRALRDPPYHRRRLMPGRLIRGAEGAPPATWGFVPLPAIRAAASPPAASAIAPSDGRSQGRDPVYDLRSDAWAREMHKRFDAYRRRVARPFRRDLFLRLDAQIVLVDLLGALRGGAPALADTQTALHDLLRAFRHGSEGGLLGRWFPRVSRVVFAVTQVDELLPEDQPRAVRALEDLLFDEVQRLRAAGVKVSLRAVAALRSARPVEHAEGRALQGFERETGQPITLLPPRLPERLPGDLNVRLEPFPRLSPPPGLRRVGGFPNFRMSEVVEDLVGDWLEART